MRLLIDRFWACSRGALIGRSAVGHTLGRGLLVAAFALVGPRIGHAQVTIGWRTDGTGSYPKAQPPHKWSATKNVVWFTPMPGYGVSHPVLLGQHVFTCAEPATLLCIKRDDGKIVWQKTCIYSEIEIEAEVRERLKVELAEVA